MGSYTISKLCVSGTVLYSNTGSLLFSSSIRSEGSPLPTEVALVRVPWRRCSISLYECAGRFLIFLLETRLQEETGSRRILGCVCRPLQHVPSVAWPWGVPALRFPQSPPEGSHSHSYLGTPGLWLPRTHHCSAASRRCAFRRFDECEFLSFCGLIGISLITNVSECIFIFTGHLGFFGGMPVGVLGPFSI